MTDTRIAKLMWDAYAIQAGWDSFDGKPLPAWDELSEDRQSCWVAAASVTADRIEKLEAQLAQSQLKRWAARREEQSDRIEKLEAALRSIAANACCYSCRKTAFVARKALEGKDGT